MKKIVVIGCITIYGLYSCKSPVKANESAPKVDEAKILYEKNFITLKRSIAAFENENLEEWAATISDTTIWNSPVYGSSPGTKEDWRKYVAEYFKEWDSLKLNFPDFLPGIDSATHEFDGSARYYGIWTGVHKSGARASVNFYATYDFNKDNKIVNASEFFDVGGLMNTVKQKK